MTNRVLACDMCDVPMAADQEWHSVGGFLGVCRACWLAGNVNVWKWARRHTA